MRDSLRGANVLVAHECATQAWVIQRAAREAGADIVCRAGDAVEAIEHVRQQTAMRHALVLSHGLSGDTLALIDVATEHNARIVIVYPVGSNPAFPFVDNQCLVAPYTRREVVLALAQALARTRGCVH